MNQALKITADTAMTKAKFYRSLGFDILSCHAINGQPQVTVRPGKSFDPIVKLAMAINGYDDGEIIWTRKH